MMHLHFVRQDDATRIGSVENQLAASRGSELIAKIQITLGKPPVPETLSKNSRRDDRRAWTRSATQSQNGAEYEPDLRHNQS